MHEINVEVASMSASTDKNQSETVVKKRKELDAKAYWDGRYAAGGTSGPGSIRRLAHYKNTFLNRFVMKTGSQSLIELGCGDGLQLKNARYPKYIGLDISQEAVKRCEGLYGTDRSKTFYTMDQIDKTPNADIGLSLDVIYHILNTTHYHEYLRALFRKSNNYVIIYGNDTQFEYGPKHVKLRDFLKDINESYPEWRLQGFDRNPYYSDIGTVAGRTWANFFVYGKSIDESARLRTNATRVSVRDTSSDLDSALSDIARLLALEFPDSLVSEQRTDALNDDGKKRAARPLSLMRMDFDNESLKNIPTGSVALLERNSDALEKILELESQFFIKDVSGAVLNNNLRKDWFFIIKTPRPRVVVSLTTISARINQISRVINSIIQQSIKPDIVTLNISEDPYLLDEGIRKSDIPKDLIILEQQGLLEINWVPNTGPYRKLIDTASRYAQTNTIIVTADDDVLLPRDWLRLLLREYYRTGCSVCFRSRTMGFENGAFLPYRKWDVKESDEPRTDRSNFTMATGNQGVLYHVSFFGPILFDRAFQECSPKADDLFYKICLSAAGIETANVVLNDTEQHLYDLKFGSLNNRGVALFFDNKKQNDEQFDYFIRYGRDHYDLKFFDIPFRGLIDS